MKALDLPTAEIAMPLGNLQVGTAGVGVKRIQEWLGLHGYAVNIDGDFGSATQAAVRAFQHAEGCVPSGRVDIDTWKKLVLPLISADQITVPPGTPFGQVVVVCARAHLLAKPREVGGDNCGPWVRRYCHGLDGAEYPWCQGFASEMWLLAAHVLGIGPPFPLGPNGTPSLYVPWVVSAAREAGKFRVPGEIGAVPIGSMAFIPGGSAGYVHVALVVASTLETITTIEGNTNHDGGANGYEVAQRFRRRASCHYGLAV